jgi:hypothetical protein
VPEGRVRGTRRTRGARWGTHTEPSRLKGLRPGAGLADARIPAAAGFQQRLGKPTDFFFSGVFPAAEKRIGFIRIPVMAPTAGPEADGIAQFAAEIAFM